MQKNKISLEVKKENRIYEFICIPEAPLGEVFDVLSEMKSYVVEKIQQIESKSKDEDQRVLDGNQ